MLPVLSHTLSIMGQYQLFSSSASQYHHMGELLEC